MKTCSSCKIEKPLVEFQRQSRYADGLDTRCKSCANTYKNVWARKNAEQLREKSRLYRAENPERWKAIKNRYNHSQKGIENRQRYYLSIRQKTLEHYGDTPPRCACCNERASAFLTIDHINGGGHQQRQHLNRTGWRFYDWLKKQGWPEGYQVLCYNCNQAKHIYGHCPHQVRHIEYSANKR